MRKLDRPNPGHGRHADRSARRRPGKGRTLIGLAAVATATTLILTPAFGFFSDQESAGADAHAGSLNIESRGLGVTYTRDAAGEFTSEGVNGQVVQHYVPGQVMKVDGNVDNLGNKSAWIRSAIDLTNATPELAPQLYFYAGNDLPTHEQLAAADLAEDAENGELEALPGFVGVGDDLLGQGLHSSDDAIEIVSGDVNDDQAEHDGPSDRYHAQVIVYFDKDAAPSTQGQAFEFDVVVEAIQYRNNSSRQNINWADAVDYDQTTTGIR